MSHFFKAIYSFLLPGEQFASWICIVFGIEPCNWKISYYCGINWYNIVVISVACYKKISCIKTVAARTCRNTYKINVSEMSHSFQHKMESH